MALSTLRQRLDATLREETSQFEEQYEKWRLGQLELRDQREALKQEEAELKRAQESLQAAKASFDAHITKKLGAAAPEDRRVKLNVGGHVFETTAGVLQKDRFSFLAALASKAADETADGAAPVFVDRDWWLFRHILSWCREEVLPDSPDVLKSLYVESAYYRLFSMRAAIERKFRDLVVPGSRLLSAPPPTALPSTTYPPVAAASLPGDPYAASRLRAKAALDWTLQSAAAVDAGVPVASTLPYPGSSAARATADAVLGAPVTAADRRDLDALAFTEAGLGDNTWHDAGRLPRYRRDPLHDVDDIMHSRRRPHLTSADYYSGNYRRLYEVDAWRGDADRRNRLAAATELPDPFGFTSKGGPGGRGAYRRSMTPGRYRRRHHHQQYDLDPASVSLGLAVGLETAMPQRYHRRPYM